MGARVVVLAPLLAIAVALVALLRGGSLDSLSSTTFRWTPLLVTGLVIQIAFEYWAPEELTREGAITVIIASYAAVAGFTVLNRKLPGMLLATAGLMLNVAVIAANGAMPVSVDAARAAGTRPPETSVKHTLIDDDTRLRWLADVIPVPGLQTVVSVGDVILSIGIARLVYIRTRVGDKNPKEASG